MSKNDIRLYIEVTKKKMKKEKFLGYRKNKKQSGLGISSRILKFQLKSFSLIQVKFPNSFYFLTVKGAEGKAVW